MPAWFDRMVSNARVAPAKVQPAAPVQQSLPTPSNRLPAVRIVAMATSSDPWARHVRPPQRRRRDEATWVPPGQAVTIRGADIPDGMVYVGRFLSAAPSGGFGAELTASCLIDPMLPTLAFIQHSHDLGHWPSYSEIAPDSRAFYLSWLAAGKCDPSCPIGFVFLYFYGLERRLLVDNPGGEEESRLLAEVERLHAVYGGHPSFHGYSHRLLDVIKLRRLSGVPNGLSQWQPDLLDIKRGTVLPPTLTVKLALHAAIGVPLDWETSLAAMLTLSPFQGGPPLSTAMKRVRSTYIELVRRRFIKRFPDGYRLTSLRDSVMPAIYTPAAKHLDIRLGVQGMPRLPDPGALDWKKLTELCTNASTALHAYSRLAGKDGSLPSSLAAASLLPPDIADLSNAEDFKRWLGSLTSPLQVVPFADLAHRCLGLDKAPTGAKQIVEIINLLGTHGFGMEPDPTLGGEKPRDNVLLFRRGKTVSPDFTQAAIIVVALSSAEPGMDVAKLCHGLAKHLNFDLHNAVRLAARCRYTIGHPMPPGRVKTTIASLSAKERAILAAFTPQVGAILGELSAATVGTIERIVDACGGDRQSLYNTLHRGAANIADRPREPVMVWAGGGKTGFSIPPAPTTPATSRPPSEAIPLDMARVQAIKRETDEISGILAAIYEDEPAVEEALRDIPPATMPTSVAASRFDGLDDAHAGLLEALAARTLWTQSDLDELARQHGLMAGGAIEVINEWAFDHLDDVVIEDGDPLTINIALLPAAPEA